MKSTVNEIRQRFDADVERFSSSCENTAGGSVLGRSSVHGGKARQQESTTKRRRWHGES
jgi:hypothetical protein